MTASSDHLIAWVCNDYFLDTVGVVTEIFDGDLITGLVFLAIIRENLRGVDPVSVLPGPSGADGAKIVRQPVTVYAVAKRLGLTYETARRHVNRLIKDGYCKRLDGGLVVPSEVLLRPLLVRGCERHSIHFHRLVRAASHVKIVSPVAADGAAGANA